MAETSYQMLEALSFCDRERVLPSSIKMTVLTFLVKKKKPGEIKLQEVSMFRAYAKKKIKSNLVLVVGGHMSNI